jgi:hypothetical protein
MIPKEFGYSVTAGGCARKASLCAFAPDIRDDFCIGDSRPSNPD